MPAVLVQTACPIQNIPSVAVAMEHPGASGADKKRNKLGYHRTSVACVHCRRRKIRCLVSADDSQGRCENCIRLRKECQFYPVDQQPPTEKKTRPGAKLEASGVDPSVASSSPPAALGTGSMDPNDMYAYSIPMHSTPEMGDGVAHPDLVASQTIDPNASWDASGGHHRMGNPSPVIWTTQGGIPGQAAQIIPTGAGAYATVQPDGTIWPGPPQRSMTVPTQADMGGGGGGGGQFAAGAPFPQNSSIPPELKRRMTSPAQAMAGSPMQSPSPANMNLQVPVPVPVPVSYAAQPIAYRQWNGMAPMPMDGGAGYAMFSPGPVPSNYPMGGHPGQHPSSGP
ncbi:hypothetical protein BGW36DRAFT_365333 [Talaromyces proteolyticus]|uniref:Zn(2)-C6 fungal-type domain-containing protein n=1 Tax=Talaromyces proteolyticus TaxID=1131652 RepID=A0AAD4PSS5_9EURO|nr:uncharacterized protein BGW36DRAFT_365333 [Talaromyces proteolyticus]KAH8689563.1 hypothetical protein BGW36DRAFT_365333 [Talaromyces proteolyticus]